MSPTTTAQCAPWQELRLNSPVQCKDGPAGMLSHIRLYPCCGALAQLVISRSLFARPRRVVVPATCVDTVTNGQVTLNLQRAALDTFPADSSRLLRAFGADRRTAKPAASATHPHAARNGMCSTHTAVVTLGNAMAVDCEDGRAGRLAMVLLDPHTLRVLQLVVCQGLFVRRTTTVPLDWIEAITPQRIRLQAKRRRLAELPPFHGDDEIVDDVRYGLRTAAGQWACGAWTAIEVASYSGVVLLHGNVRSSAHKQEAEQIAQQSLCVRHVCNELISDDELEQCIKRALLTHTRLRVRRIELRVELGIVELAGEVERREHVAQAEALVRQLHGVRLINNHLCASMHDERVSAAEARDSVVVQRRSWAGEREAALYDSSSSAAFDG